EAAMAVTPSFLKLLGKLRKGKKAVEALERAEAKALPSPRRSLLDRAKDSRLRKTIDELYRPNAKVGSGSSMDALRYEKATGKLLSKSGHAQKLVERRSQLMKLLRDPSINESNRAIIKEIL